MQLSNARRRRGRRILDHLTRLPYSPGMAQRLLLADDSVTIQKVIELTFADEHIEVVAVSDGAAAVARLKAEPFDIVLADAGMPGVNGFDVATFVRDRPAGRIPVILLTGAFDPVDESR